MTSPSSGAAPPPVVDPQSRERFDRRTSARIFELLARAPWLGFLAGAFLAELGLYGWRRVVAGDTLAPGVTETTLLVLAASGAAFEVALALGFCWRRRAPLASLVGARRDIAVVSCVLIAAGALAAVALRLLGNGAQSMVAPTAVGVATSAALWLLVTAHAWAAGRVAEHRRLVEAHRLAGDGRLTIGRLYLTARLIYAVTKMLLVLLYAPIAWVSMLGARLLRMRQEPLHFECRLQGCKFISANPAIRIHVPGVVQAPDQEPVRTWPTFDKPLFARSPREGGARLVPTWHGLHRLEQAGHLRDSPTGCARLCYQSYGRRLLVLGESGAALAAALSVVYRAAETRLRTLSPQALERKRAFDDAAAQRRWGVAGRGTTHLTIDGQGTPPARIEVDIVSELARPVWARAYGGIVVLPMRESGAEADHRTYVASRLAQIRTGRPPADGQQNAPQGGHAPAPTRGVLARARALVQRLLGRAEIAADAAGLLSGNTVVFLPDAPAAVYAELQALGARVAAEADRLCEFIEEILQ